MINIKHKLTKVLSEKLVFPSIENLGQRGVGDKIEDACNKIIVDNFSNVEMPKSNRTLEDITIIENDIKNLVDHKSSDVSRNFKMPNLISITRLKNLSYPLYYNFVMYDSVKKEIVETFVLNVYELNWDHLHIQNLGTGQLQIKNMKSFIKSPSSNLTETEWKHVLRKKAIKFSDNLIDKTEKRKASWIEWIVE